MSVSTGKVPMSEEPASYKEERELGEAALSQIVSSLSGVLTRTPPAALSRVGN